MSLSDVAREAGVSKALILYHFSDKYDLLARVIDDLATGMVDRQRAALAAEDSPLALDALWTWLSAELRMGSIATLVELGRSDCERVALAAKRASQARRSAAADTMAALFDILELVPRVPVAMLADVFICFVDGLALDAALIESRDARVAFDVFWLALLNLAD